MTWKKTFTGVFLSRLSIAVLILIGGFTLPAWGQEPPTPDQPSFDDTKCWERPAARSLGPPASRVVLGDADSRKPAADWQV